MRLTVVTLLLAALVSGGATAMPMPVPPKDCGFMTVSKRKYNIKADQLRCKKARKVTRSILKGKGRKGFRCEPPSKGSNVRLYCRKGRNTYLYAIKR